MAVVAPPAKPLTVILIGNPNTGKSTLFSALSGFHALTGNFPGVTVEKKIGRTKCGASTVDLVDLPGTYSLAPRTLDEMVAVNVLLGRQADVGTPDLVICIVDASNIERNLYLVSQVLDLALPVVVVLNMVDVATGHGIKIDEQALSRRLGLPVIKTEAHRKRGIEALREIIVTAATTRPAGRPSVFPPAFTAECERLNEWLAQWGQPDTPSYLLERLLLDVGGYVESHLVHSAAGLVATKPVAPKSALKMPASADKSASNGAAGDLTSYLVAARLRLAEQGCKVPAAEARLRYAWIKQVLDGVVSKPASRAATVSDKIDSYLTHRYAGLLFFVVLMFTLFQAVYAWAKPLMELCEKGQEQVGKLVGGLMPLGPVHSLVVDGVIGGMGAVLIFLPQIVILFLFIALLEDCGYMARAAFIVDRLMTKVGLSGKSFVPLMSSFACAVPGIMATRVIENHRDRMTTILVAPLMSCSARQPVYFLMATAFFPATAYLGGWIELPSIVMFAMTFLGALVAVPIAWLLKNTWFKGETPPFVMELPSYKWPSPRVVFSRVYDRSKAFVLRAGTLILATSVLVWGAGYFPGDHSRVNALQMEIDQLAETAPQDPDKSARLERLTSEQNHLRSELLEDSYLGRFGKSIEPVVKPLGWDWRIGVATIASFPAREVIIGTLGTIYSLGGDVEAENSSLTEAIQSATWPDGRKVYNIPVAVSIMVFFALCAQCASTLMVIRRETNSEWWAAFTFLYMTVLAYLGAWAAYQIGMLFY
ncbi:MAG TPA: ferrous iron transport protein B [Planctomycetaceae bacterium]